MRVHGTMQARPAEVFRVEEQPRLRSAPVSPYDVPIYTTAKVHRDHHIEVAKALYSIPGNLIGTRVEVRADRTLVRVFYAMRDLEHLRRLAAGHGPAVGAFAGALLDTPLPWTRIRQVYALLGLVKRWGAERVDAACASALAHEAVNVGLIGRMLERGTEHTTTPPSPPGVVVPGRFARDPEHFTTRAKDGRR
jgi:hypothetical protein